MVVNKAAQSMTSRSEPKPIGLPTELPYWQPLLDVCEQVSPVLSELLHQFWGVPVRVHFFSASAKAHYFWRADDFHVSQLMLGDAPSGQEEPPMALLRLSEGTCASLLTRVLGPHPALQKAFSFKQLSPLEATVLNEFSRDVLAAFMKNLIKKPSRPLQSEQLHLIWTVELEEAPEEPGKARPLHFKEPLDVGKIILSLPLHAVRMEALPETEPAENVPDDFFFHVEAPARIYLGGTRLALADLNGLEADDLVVLEDSNAAHMALIEPESGEKIPFPVEIRQRSRLTIPYMQEFAEMEIQTPSPSAKQNLWDNLMIEVNAEFAPIRLPLKQLKQMSEGLVIEMGDLVHNKICLQVEGKTLAWGELIIVGDKFGVRISNVEASGNASSAESMALPTVQAHASEDQAPQIAVSPEGAADSGENADTFLSDDFDDFEDEDDSW